MHFANYGQLLSALNKLQFLICFALLHTSVVCPFRINDDTEFEEEEYFEVYIKTSDKRIIIPESMSSTTVHIFDPEDGMYTQYI